MFDEWIFIPAAAKAPGPPPLAIPDTHRPYRPRHFEPQLSMGGLPVPKPKHRPKSLTVPVAPMQQTSGGFPFSVPPPQFQVSPVSQPAVSYLLQPRRARTATAGHAENSQTSQLLRLKNPSQSKWLTSEWHKILNHLDQASTVFQALKSSEHPQAHASRILDQFAPSTLLRYFSAWNGFQKTLSSFKHQHFDIDGESTCRCAYYTVLEQKIRMFSRVSSHDQSYPLDFNSRWSGRIADCVEPHDRKFFEEPYSERAERIHSFFTVYDGPTGTQNSDVLLSLARDCGHWCHFGMYLGRSSLC